MEKRIEIILHDNKSHEVHSNLNGEELFEAYCVFSTHVALMLKDKENITSLAEQASKFALDLINNNENSIQSMQNPQNQYLN